MSWLFGGGVSDSSGPLSTPASQVSTSVKSIGTKFDAYRTAAQKLEVTDKTAPGTITEDMKQKITQFSNSIAVAENDLKNAMTSIGAQAGGRRRHTRGRKSHRKSHRKAHRKAHRKGRRSAHRRSAHRRSTKSRK